MGQGVEEGEISFVLLIVLVVSLFLSDGLSECDGVPGTKIFSVKTCAVAIKTTSYMETYERNKMQNSCTVFFSDVFPHYFSLFHYLL